MRRSLLLLCGLLSLGACGDDDAKPADAGGAGADGGGGDDGGAEPTRRCQAPSPAADPGNACPSASPATLQATRIAEGFEIPVLVTYAPNDPDERLFVVERTGRIRIIKDGDTLPEPFLELNVSGGSGQNAEQGLLGLAFDPDYETNGRFYINYTGSNAMNVAKTFVVSYEVSSDPDKADASTKKPIIEYDDLESNHNGGMLAFGPDGCLYIAAGDGGGGNDPSGSHGPIGSGQALDTPLGKLLRLDVDHPMERAPGNLTASGAIPHIWDYGLRNPWRFSFDRETGDLYIGDVGQDHWEEVDVEPKGTGRKNYGWRVMEGAHCRGDESLAGDSCPEGDDTSEYTDPVHEYRNTNGASNCVIGGYVYRGQAIRSLRSWYVFGDNGSSQTWALVWNETGACADPIELTSQLVVSGGITSFGEDATGELYITTEAGYVYRIDPA